MHRSLLTELGEFVAQQAINRSLLTELKLAPLRLHCLHSGRKGKRVIVL